jgi:hypothetical protein
LSGEIRYYKGLHRVRVATQSQGYLIVEALEDFEDCVNGQTTKVKAGEQRIVPPNLVFKERKLPPIVKEHEYELKMEKKVQRMVTEDEKKQSQRENTG